MATESLFLHTLLSATPVEAWQAIRMYLTEVWSAPFRPGKELSDTRHRDREMAHLDLLLSHSLWPLWQSFTTTVPKASDALSESWGAHSGGLAILILDGLSLREWPVLVHEAAARGFTLQSSQVLASELPAETTTFARALGFPLRSTLDNNGAASLQFPGAVTLTHNLPWQDAAAAVPPAPRLICWHHWPDDRMHALDGPDGGLDKFQTEILHTFRSEAFWHFLSKLAQDRRLLITSDHGYAHTGVFPNVPGDQKDYLKEKFAAQRFRIGSIDTRAWLPPLTALVDTAVGPVTFVTGRRKWQVPGGFPALSHGGLTLMETFVPFIELSK